MSLQGQGLSGLNYWKSPVISPERSGYDILIKDYEGKKVKINKYNAWMNHSQ